MKLPSPSCILRFGVFQINLAARELRKHGVRVRLPRQPFYILSILLEKPGEVITREEMRQKLWSADTFVDFEHGLNSAIKKVRAALGDSPDNSRYIETIPRVGYRFIAPVERVSTAAPNPSDVPVNTGLIEPVLTPDGTLTQKSLNPLGLSMPRFAASFVILVIAATGAYFTWSHLRGVTQPKTKTASGPESSKPVSKPVSSAKSAEAYELYLKGIYFWNKRTGAGFQQAIDYFQQATTVDPNYAPAYAGLANSYTLLTAYSASSPTIYMPQARAAVKRALELDDGLAEAHTALALIVQNHDWDWQTSEKEYRRAIELDPNYATAHQWYAEHLMWRGRFDEASRESERARRLDPLSLIIAADNGAILYFARQYERAIDKWRSVLQIDPDFPRAHVIALAYVEKGMFAEALADVETQRAVTAAPIYWGIVAYIDGRAGRTAVARAAIDSLLRSTQHQPVQAGVIAEAYAGVADKEQALDWLERAYAQHSNDMTTLKVAPAYDVLRGDSRYQRLL